MNKDEGYQVTEKGEVDMNLIFVKQTLSIALAEAEAAGLYVRIDQIMQDPPAMGNTKPVIIVEPKYRPS